VLGLSGAAGRKRSVTGSRQSAWPGRLGATVMIGLGSTVRSSEPATGRSNVTAIGLVGGAPSAGTVRSTRSGPASAEIPARAAVSAVRI